MCVGLGGGDDGGGGCGIVVGSTDPENMRLFPLLPTDCWGLRLICSQCWHSYGGIASKILTTQNSFLAGPLPPSSTFSMGRGESSPGKRRRGNEDHRGHHHGRGEGGRGNGRGIGSIYGCRRAHGHEGLDNQHRRALDVMACSADDASSITNTNTYPGSSTATEAKSGKSSPSTLPSTITILPWINPQSHYIPVEEEERLLPVLLHWGRSERGMMKDQPPFRLQKIQKMLDMQWNNTPSNTNNNKNNNKQQQSSTTTTRSCYCRMTLLQSLSLRRHHLKLQNPKLSMPALRLGSDDDIKEAARLFECCVGVYLRTHNIPFITEDEQKTRFTRSITPDMKRSGIVKQPPTPDFMIMVGHSVVLSYTNNINNTYSGTKRIIGSDEKSVSSSSCPIAIHWIEVKMFYGASTIPSGTSNAVGCILPKVKQYVSLYGTGAIVFMYGCGLTLAEQLLNAGVVALDGRCLDLDSVERHQKRWCADSWGNILF